MPELEDIHKKWNFRLPVHFSFLFAFGKLTFLVAKLFYTCFCLSVHWYDSSYRQFGHVRIVVSISNFEGGFLNCLGTNFKNVATP